MVELWSSSDDYYLHRLSPKYGANAPWAVSVYTISAASLQMLSVAHPELNPAGYEDQFTDYIVVAALNPMAVSKVGYTDLPRFANMMFNAHCARIESKIKTGVSNALYYETDLDWDMAGQSFSRWWWHAPSFDINDLLAGVDITNSDVAQMFTAKATFGAFFKDSVNAMATMNMEVQTYLFAIFPEVIYNDVAAMYNGAFQQAGIDARFEIRPFSN